MVLLWWASIGVVMGLIAHAFLRARGEQGFNVIGEILLGATGSLTLGMVFGIVFGWRGDFNKGNFNPFVDPNTIVAIVGGALTIGTLIYFTLISSPLRNPVSRPPQS